MKAGTGAAKQPSAYTILSNQSVSAGAITWQFTPMRANSRASSQPVGPAS